MAEPYDSPGRRALGYLEAEALFLSVVATGTRPTDTAQELAVVNARRRLLCSGLVRPAAAGCGADALADVPHGLPGRPLGGCALTEAAGWTDLLPVVLPCKERWVGAWTKVGAAQFTMGEASFRRARGG